MRNGDCDYRRVRILLELPSECCELRTGIQAIMLTCCLSENVGGSRGDVSLSTEDCHDGVEFEMKMSPCEGMDVRRCWPTFLLAMEQSEKVERRTEEQSERTTCGGIRTASMCLFPNSDSAQLILSYRVPYPKSVVLLFISCSTYASWVLEVGSHTSHSSIHTLNTAQFPPF